MRTSVPAAPGRRTTTVAAGLIGMSAGFGEATSRQYRHLYSPHMVERPPSVDSLASELEDGTLPRALLVDIARSAIADWRDEGPESTDPRTRAGRAAEALRRLRPGRVVNATGVLLHTNLGRAVLHPDAADAARTAGGSASAIEFDLETGRRGGRGAYACKLAASLTGAEAEIGRAHV